MVFKKYIKIATIMSNNSTFEIAALFNDKSIKWIGNKSVNECRISDVTPIYESLNK